MSDIVRTAITQQAIQQAQADAGDLYQVEVVNGDIIKVERHMTMMHIFIIRKLFLLLHEYVQANQLGIVFPDGARYIIVGNKTNIQRARQPDLSFLRAGRIPADFDWSGDYEGAPDFAVEVASPGQTNADLLDRITDYLSNGTDEAWLIYPKREQVFQFRRSDNAPNIYDKPDAIDTTTLLPGFQIRLADLMNTTQA